MLMDCIKLQKRKIKIISLILAVSLLVNLILAVMLCTRLTHKAADVKQQTTATAAANCSPSDTNTYITDRGRLPWSQTILAQNTRCKICKNANLKNLSGNSYFPTRKRRYLPIFMYRNYPCGRWGTTTATARAV